MVGSSETFSMAWKETLINILPMRFYICGEKSQVWNEINYPDHNMRSTIHVEFLTTSTEIAVHVYRDDMQNDHVTFSMS